jgi:hypothetical protein
MNKPVSSHSPHITAATLYFFFSASSIEATTAGSLTFVLGSMRWIG